MATLGAESALIIGINRREAHVGENLAEVDGLFLGEHSMLVPQGNASGQFRIGHVELPFAQEAPSSSFHLGSQLGKHIRIRASSDVELEESQSIINRMGIPGEAFHERLVVAQVLEALLG